MDEIEQRKKFESFFLLFNEDVSGIPSGDDLLYCSTDGVYEVWQTQRMWEAWKKVIK